MTQLAKIIHQAKPLTLRPEITIKRACQLMRQAHASAVLVTHSGGYLLGIFTGRDAIGRVLATGENAAEVTLGEVMTENPVTISQYTTAIEALRLMWDGGFRHLPVTEKGRVIGLLRRRDFKSEDLSWLESERELWEHMR